MPTKQTTKIICLRVTYTFLFTPASIPAQEKCEPSESGRCDSGLSSAKDTSAGLGDYNDSVTWEVSGH